MDHPIATAAAARSAPGPQVDSPARKRVNLKLLGVAALAYLLLPLDLIPDVVPLVGWIDDAGVLSAVALFAAQELRKRKRVTG